MPLNHIFARDLLVANHKGSDRQPVLTYFGCECVKSFDTFRAFQKDLNVFNHLTHLQRRNRFRHILNLNVSIHSDMFTAIREFLIDFIPECVKTYRTHLRRIENDVLWFIVLFITKQRKSNLNQ